MSTFEIAGREIGDNHEPFIIAEAGINHNGDIELAKKMIVAAKAAGVDAIKFQTFHADEFIQDASLMYTYRSQGKEVTESMLSMFRRYEFNEGEWRQIKKFCDKEKILFLSTPQNVSDLEVLLDLGVEAIKIGSDDFTNVPLVRQYAKTNLPLLLSCGMATDGEIEQTLRVSGIFDGKPVALFLCTSEYPTPPDDVNIFKLRTISQKYPQVVMGFSDHTQGDTAAIMATTLGARVFEKHFTLDHSFPGPDHWFSEEPEELSKWVKSIKVAHQMLGSPFLEPTPKEMEMRKLAHRSIIALVDIKEGEVFQENNLSLRRPGTGISAYEWDRILGKKAACNVIKGKQIKWEDIYE